MARQPFNDFLNSPLGGPSTPRGGRGGGAGRGGGRGEGGGLRGGGAAKSFKADYSNVPFDYTAVNKQSYTKMDGFAVAPFGGNVGSPSTPGSRGRGRGGRGGGNYTPRGGRGGGLGYNTSTPGQREPAQQDSPAPSGYGTPITGLGYHKGKGKGIGGARTPVRVESTVGRGLGTGEVMWGGRGAPIFVKAGELFKDAEPEMPDSTQHDVHQPGSPPKAQTTPHVLDIRSDTEMDILESALGSASLDGSLRDVQSAQGMAEALAQEDLAFETEEANEDLSATEEVDTLLQAEPEAPSPVSQPSILSVALQIAASVEPTPTAAMEIDDTPAPELFIDTAPEQPRFEPASTLYTTHLFAPVGTAQSSSKPHSDEEEIVFRPRKYKQPQPIQLDRSTPAARPDPTPKPQSQPSAVPSIQAFIDPRAQKPIIPRKDKKAAKKEKKKKRGKGKRPTGRREDMGAEDDIDWGSDGPPEDLLRIEGLDEEVYINTGTKRDFDMEILKDYLEGTRLGTMNEDDSDDDDEATSAIAMEVVKKEIVVEVQKKDKGKKKAVADHKTPADVESIYQKGGEKRQTRYKQKSVDKKLARDWEQPLESMMPINGANGGPSQKENDSTSDKSDDDDDADEGSWEDEDGDAGQDGRDVVGDSESNDEGDAASDDSSIVGDIQAIMDALDSESGEESEEDDDTRFTGKNMWTSEDEGEWFIRNMEEALGGGASVSFGTNSKHKGKGKMAAFLDVENGDFDMALPTGQLDPASATDEWQLINAEPVKKGKKKAQGIPEALQAQWEADRQKKADKKHQREMDRLFAEIESVKSTKKGKFKGQSKAQQAAFAHLIPASASQVADMFDIDSDDERTQHIRGVGKMRKMMNLPSMPGAGGVGDIGSLVEEVREFIRDPGQTTLSLRPMEKEGRQKMHLLAECFGLNSSSKGAGKGRFTIFIKTSRTGLYVDEARLEKFVTASSHSGGNFYRALRTGGIKMKWKKDPRGDVYGGGNGKGEKKRGPGDRGTSGRAKEGDLVGEGADRIGESNMGHKLLSMMGWAEGGRIGRSDGGLSIPIVAVVKNTKSGLGA